MIITALDRLWISLAKVAEESEALLESADLHDSERQEHFDDLKLYLSAVFDLAAEEQASIVTNDGTSTAQWVLSLRRELRRIHELAAAYAESPDQRTRIERSELLSLILSMHQRAELGRDLSDLPATKVSEAVAEPGPAADRLSRALGLLAAHPDWSDKQIAEGVGIHPKTMNKPRWARYRAARDAMRATLPKGAKGADGTIEAWDSE